MWIQFLNEGDIFQKFFKYIDISSTYKLHGYKVKTENYRPTSLTYNLIKVFEKIMKKKIVSHLEGNNSINDFQHEFGDKQSCLSELIYYYNFMIKSILENDGNVDIIYLDFFKAFDKIHR